MKKQQQKKVIKNLLQVFNYSDIRSPRLNLLSFLLKTETCCSILLLLFKKKKKISGII